MKVHGGDILFLFVESYIRKLEYFVWYQFSIYNLSLSNVLMINVEICFVKFLYFSIFLDFNVILSKYLQNSFFIFFYLVKVNYWKSKPKSNLVMLIAIKMWCLFLIALSDSDIIQVIKYYNRLIDIVSRYNGLHDKIIQGFFYIMKIKTKYLS